MLDLRTGSVMQTYPDIQNFRPPLASLISPCGTWVAGGSDCGVALLWNTDTGDKRDRSAGFSYSQYSLIIIIDGKIGWL